MAQEPNVPLTREGAVGAVKLLMIVLVAGIFWKAAGAVNEELHARGMVTAAPFLRGAATLLIGTETTAPFGDRLGAFWQANHRAVSLVAMLIATMLLSTRYLLFGRIFDYLYLESPVRDKRIYSGFIANILMSVVHAGMVYSLILLGQGAHADLVPLALILLLLAQLAWIGALWVAVRPVERQGLRGIKYLAITAGAVIVLLFIVAWRLEQLSVAAPAVQGSALTLLAAVAIVLLCLADGIIQGRLYFGRRQSQARA